jgi:hypothetical protein
MFRRAPASGNLQLAIDMNPQLKQFITKYQKDSITPTALTDEAETFREPLFEEFEEHVGFGSFESGLIRVFKPGRMEALAAWGAIGKQKAPMQVYSRFVPFASSWHGDLFCLDTHLHENQRFAICLLEPGTGKLLRIAPTIEQFFSETLINERESALVSSFYGAWRLSGGAVPTFSECIGYKVPMFLNGADTVNNLEAINQDIYITLSGQMFAQLSSLPPGTPISQFRRSRM